ncbi:MAG: hypothetical protein KC492_06980 [Myxococcales bacterium]|nr:hypothetical protein [Myxococcales bacterium]MCB9608281.1 hypothetical protein [Polyangiaceae bacterium]
MSSRPLFIGLALLCLHCHKDEQGTAGANAQASAGVSRAGWTHVKQSAGECSFEFDVPEQLKETDKSDFSVNLASENFAFFGAEGQSLTSEPKSTFDMFKGEYEDVYRGVNAGLNLAIVKKKKDDGQADKNSEISGTGGEPYKSERYEGCAFNCSGSRAKQAEVVEFCKSVRVTVTPKAE